VDLVEREVDPFLTEAHLVQRRELASLVQAALVVNPRPLLAGLLLAGPQRLDVLVEAVVPLALHVGSSGPERVRAGYWFGTRPTRSTPPNDCRAPASLGVLG